MRAKRRTLRQPKLSLSPLLDMVFILVIFFAVSTTFSQLPGTKITLPESATTEKLPPNLIMIGITENGSLYINQTLVSAAKLKRHLAEKSSAQIQAQVALIADQNTPLKFIVKVMDLCKQVGITDVSIAERNKEIS